MPLVDDEVRALFPGFTDEEIQSLYERTEKLSEGSGGIPICETDLRLAIVARELGWEALCAYLVALTGNHRLNADDIYAIAQAATYLRFNDDSTLYKALYGASSEATSRKTVNARKSGLKHLTKPLANFNYLEGV